MPSEVVKSAARTLEILELFAARQEPLTPSQIGTVLKYPKSSLSVLLKSLVSQGYLTTVAPDGAFFPTMKLSRLGEWIPAALFGAEGVQAVLEALRDRTGETVTLTAASGLNMRVLHAIPGTHPIALVIEEGMLLPMIGTAIGTMYLATLSATAAERTLDAWAHQSKRVQRKRLPELREMIAEARSQGVARAYDAVIPDTGALAMPVWPREGSEAVVIAVAGLSQRIRKREAAIIRAMHKTITGASEQGHIRAQLQK